MNLVWKLLRQHISIPQFAGFAFANLFGMLIVLFGFQFYKDVLPVFTQQDSFMKADYLIMSKKIGMVTPSVVVLIPSRAVMWTISPRKSLSRR
jgi:hypothetical protein